ncbi:coiled-coil domain-containing protein [Endozoicomonas euniceicola]|uniref:Uncharacterized protein n=1 Tax=Endozoicomonas euniceicola TaxID=1234143 RepID=A0ABY6GR90_9GAMM|nr:hypothetical protein [Endozoicomonas euniceicola]UYM15077.1 hypothetical protein NX720_19725 [Endozoicomonas euniceicola]
MPRPSETPDSASADSAYSSLGSDVFPASPNESEIAHAMGTDNAEAQEKAETPANDDVQPSEKKDTRNRKQKVADTIRAKSRKLKSAVYGEAKRWITGKNWKKVPDAVLKSFPENIQTQFETRNNKLDRLAELKSLKQETQQFERQFGKELSLLASDKAPKSGKFKIPGTGKEFVFSKNQSQEKKAEILGEFKEAFKGAEEFESYQKAGNETKKYDVDRSELKDELSKLTQDLAGEIDAAYDRAETKIHKGIDERAENYKNQLDKNRASAKVGYQNEFNRYQGMAYEAKVNLDRLIYNIDKIKAVDISGNNHAIKDLESQLVKQTEILKKQFNALPKSERKGTDKKTFLQSGLHPLNESLKNAREKKVGLEKKLSELQAKRPELESRLEKAERDLQTLRNTDVLGAIMDKYDEVQANEDKRIEEEHKQITENTEKQKGTMKKAIRGR